jgi:DNA-binding SARP family transcriptional activator/tetratricopeptide (TPR) repeat protein
VANVDLEIRILGPLQLWAHGRQVSAGSAKQRALLTLLAQHAPAAVTAETIVQQLWPNGDHDEVRSNLQTLVSRLRKVLTDAGAPDAVPRAGHGYRLAVPANTIDLHRFQQRLDLAHAAAAQQRPDQVIELVTEALLWWHEPVLADLRTEWAERRRHHLASVTLLAAHTLLFEAKLAVGDHHAVLTHLPDLLERYPTNERLATHWMRALAASGRLSDTAQFYASFQRRLVRETGTPPSAELDKVYRRLSTPRPNDAPVKLDSAPARPRQLPAPPPELPGRAEQLATLTRLAAERAVSGGTIVLTGLAGIGKSSLAQYWAHHHADRYGDGQIYLNMSAHGPRSPLDPDTALTAMLESVGLPADRLPADHERRRRRLADLVAHRRMLVILDDVADTTQARALIVTAPGCLFLLTSRHQLQPLVVEDGAAPVPVPLLDTNDSITVLRRILGDRAEPATLRAAADSASGIPLGLRILGHHLAARPRLTVAEQPSRLRQRLLEPGTDEAVTLRDAFDLSDHYLPEPAKALLYRLPLHPGLSLDAGAAAALADTDIASATRLLSLLAQRNLVFPADDDRVTLHDLIRDYAHLRGNETHTAAQMQAARRRLLDYYTASTAHAARLTTPHQTPLFDVPTTIPPRPLSSTAEALDWCRTERATLLALTHDAANHGFHRHAWLLPGFYCQLLDRLGHYTDQIQAHTTAVGAAVADHHPQGTAIAVANLGAIYFRLNHHRLAEICFRHGLDFARDANNPALIDGLQYNLAATYLHLGDTPTAVRLFKAVLYTSRAHGDEHAEGFALHQLGHAHRLAQQHSQATLYLQAALTLRQRLGAPREQAATLAEFAALHLDVGDTYLALARCTRALELDDNAADRVAECDTLITIAHVRTALGQPHVAVRDARRALELSTQHANSRQHASALTELADALAATDRHHEAAQAARAAHAIRQDLDRAHPPLSDLPAILQPTAPSRAG